MSHFFLPLSVAVVFFSSCSTIDRMNGLVNESTVSIQYNSEAIAACTAAIRQNAYLVDESSKAIETNRALLEAESK